MQNINISAADIRIDLIAGPIGSRGFRRGTWTATYNGEQFQFFASVPHAMDLDDQHARLQQVAARHLKHRARSALDFRVLVDNAGGAILRVGNEYAHYYRDGGSVAEDVAELLRGSDVSTWDGNESEAMDAAENGQFDDVWDRADFMGFLAGSLADQTAALEDVSSLSLQSCLYNLSRAGVR